MIFAWVEKHVKRQSLLLGWNEIEPCLRRSAGLLDFVYSLSAGDWVSINYKRETYRVAITDGDAYVVLAAAERRQWIKLASADRCDAYIGCWWSQAIRYVRAVTQSVSIYFQPDTDSCG